MQHAVNTTLTTLNGIVVQWESLRVAFFVKSEKTSGSVCAAAWNSPADCRLWLRAIWCEARILSVWWTTVLATVGRVTETVNWSQNQNNDIKEYNMLHRARGRWQVSADLLVHNNYFHIKHSHLIHFEDKSIACSSSGYVASSNFTVCHCSAYSELVIGFVDPCPCGMTHTLKRFKFPV